MSENAFDTGSNRVPKVLVAVATYNEIENLPSLVAQIRQTVPDADILVVDDNSPDGTGQWVLEQSQTDSRIIPMNRSGKMGLGTAVLAALQFALEHQYHFIVNLDADFSHPIEVIPQLLQRVEGFAPQRDSLPADAGRISLEPVDVVIGSRYVPGGGVVGWPFSRRIMSRGVNLFARTMLRLTTRDNSGSFRCYRVSALARLDLANVRSRGYSFFEEILFRLQRTNASFAEIPIIFTDRTKGVSKINKKEALSALWTIFWLGVTGR